jgi:uncharacterized protein YhfF
VSWPRIDGLRTLELGTPGEMRARLTSYVLDGDKRGTAGLLAEYAEEGEELSASARCSSSWTTTCGSSPG